MIIGQPCIMNHVSITLLLFRFQIYYSKIKLILVKIEISIEGLTRSTNVIISIVDNFIIKLLQSYISVASKSWMLSFQSIQPLTKILQKKVFLDFQKKVLLLIEDNQTTFRCNENMHFTVLSLHSFVQDHLLTFYFVTLRKYSIFSFCTISKYQIFDFF